MTKALNPTFNILVGDILRLPCIENLSSKHEIESTVDDLIVLSAEDWVLSETSWGFREITWCAPMKNKLQNGRVENSWLNFHSTRIIAINEASELEENINYLFLKEYGLENGADATRDARKIQFHRPKIASDTAELISYAIGCMMGRYSLDEPGLIYAHAGNVGFDPSRYEKKVPADSDGIVPITFERWSEDDAASRVREFLRAVWGADTLEENMAWLAESLGMKSTKGGVETPDETIRRYLADKFFKDHLQTYNKRPIYWLFSSGKQGAFQALVYLHRYHEGTLARMRAEYVLPLTGKMQGRIESLQADIRAASSSAACTKLNKQLEALKKQQLELLAYDEKLRRHADMRIGLDLDDGVKVNYGRFGDLLAEVNAVTGGAGDE